MARGITRREALVGAVGLLGGVAIRPLLSPAGQLASLVNRPGNQFPAGAPGWTLSPKNPVLDISPSPGWTDRAVYDASVARRDGGALWMWYSTRGAKPSSIGLAVDSTGSGDNWLPYGGEPVLQPSPPESLPYSEISRPSVLLTPAGWRMWYSVVGPDGAWIGAATSDDGIHWQKHGAPVLEPEHPWEGAGVQCPNVIYDDDGRFKMWYSGGELYEPDAVGFATSSDGYTWSRAGSAPIFGLSSGWEDHKIGSFQVHHVGDWYHAFYNAFQGRPFVSRIGMARSRDGVGGWERHSDNPVLSPGPPDTWSAAMVYKPTALWDSAKQRWDVWFNASERLNGVERIGHAWRDGLW